MKLLVILTLAAACHAAPQQNPQDVQIVRYESDNTGLDSYRFAWETSDGSKHEEQGQLQNQGTENEGLVVRGQYAWVGPDGVTYVVTYVADDKGFQPTIEQGPGGAVPSAVVASLLGVEQSDGIKRKAQGSLINAGKEDAAVAIKSVFSFLIDGIQYAVKYTADEEGYKPSIEQGPGGATAPPGPCSMDAMTPGGTPPGVIASILAG